MASSLDDQLKITMQIAQASERVAKSHEQIEQALTSQLQLVQQLAVAFNQVKTGDAEQDVNKMKDAVDELAKELEGIGDISENNIGKLGEDAVKSDKSLSSLAKKATIAGAAISGLNQGFKNVMALSKGLVGFVTGLASGFAQVSLSIISIPLKIFTGLVDLAAQASGGTSEFLQQLEELRKEFGSFKGPESSAVLTTFRSFEGFSATGLSLYRVFGNIAQRLQAVREVAAAMGPTFGILADEFRENGGALLAFQKGLGIANENMKTLGERAITSGQPLSDLMLDISKQTLELGEAFGISQKLIGRDISKASGDVAHFGQLTVKEIGRASVYARKLGVELEKITGILGAFETFDSAAENAAKLSQSFGVAVDAFKLMEAQSPDEQIEMLRKQFKLANVDASTFNRQQLKLLTSTTGLDEATARQVFSMKNQGASLEDIKKKSEAAEKKQLSQAEAMSKLADSIERLVQSGASQTGGFWDMFIKGFFRGIQSSKEFRQTIWNIKHALQQTMWEGVKLGRAFVKIFPGVQQLLGGIKDFFQPAKFKGFFGGVTKEFTAFFEAMKEGKGSLPELFNHLQKNFFKFFNSEDSAGRDIINGFQKFTKSLSNIVGQAIPFITDQVGKGLKLIAEFIADPAKFGQSLKGPASKAKGFVGELLSPIIDGIKKAAKSSEFKDGLKSFVTVVGDRLKQLFESKTFRSIAKTIMMSMAGVLFGPLILQTVLGGIITSVASSAFGLIKSVLSKKGIEGLGGKAGSKGLGKLLGTAGPVAAIAAAGIAIGKGVNTYTDKITGSMDKSSKRIAAAGTGLVDGITLGLLPEGWLITIGNALAKATDSLFNMVGNYFGATFSQSLKDYIGDQLAVVGSIWGVIANLFGDDQAAFDKSVDELGMNLLKMIGSAADFMVIQLPGLLIRISNKITSMFTNLLIKIVVGSFNAIGGILEKVGLPANPLKSKIAQFSTDLQKANTEMANKHNASIKKWTDDLVATNKKAREKLLGSAEENANANKNSTAKLGEIGRSAISGSEKQSLSSVLSDIKAAKQIKKELGGKNGVNFKEMIASARDSLKGVDFNILTDDQASALSTTTDQISKVSDTLESIQTVFDKIESIPKGIKAAQAIIKNNAFKPAVEAVQEMVKLANDMDSALADGNLNKVDVRTKLQRVATNLGLGAKAKYTIQNKSVNITVNLQVSMNAEDLEKALLMRTKSVITQRLNFFAENPEKKAGPAIPTTPGGVINPIASVD